MGRVAKRSSLKPFVKVINYQHLMPTRYTVDINLNKEIVKEKSLGDPVEKLKVRKEVKAAFEDRYKTGKNRWFFSKLRIQGAFQPSRCVHDGGEVGSEKSK